MALYFIRSTPSATTGLSPFMARQGWEPVTPIQLLYKTWAQTDLGDVDLAEWVTVNSERVEIAREKALLTKFVTADKRKKTWDTKAKNREFDVGQEVLVRKPGLNLKLSDSREGPFKITKRNSPLSYSIDTGDRRIPSVHIQLIKAYNREEDVMVSRVTSVFEPDKPGDDILERYAEAHISDSELSDKQKEDLDRVLSNFTDVMTSELRLTNLVDFAIDTGDSQPIFQRPYNSPAAFKKDIDKEIDWLLEKGYVRPSTSPWSSPMVTVRKPDGTARLCIDIKKINAITRQQPFFMPRVEEVLECVGKASFISKLDLTKGYYQIKMCDSDVPKTAFICHRGKYEFLRMPFGVKNAPAVFQELMQALLHDHKTFSTPYMDDVIIYSDMWEAHLDHIRLVLESLRSAGLTANPKKCGWGGRHMEFLGHQVGGGKMSMPEHRSQALGK